MYAVNTLASMLANSQGYRYKVTNVRVFEKTGYIPFDSARRDRKMSVCVCVCMCVCVCVCVSVCLYVCAPFDFQSIRASFSEMAEPIWTNLGSFESYYWAIDQVRRAYGYHFRFRRYTHLSDVSDIFAFFRVRARFSEMAGPIWTNLSSFQSYYWAIDQVRKAHGWHFRFRRYNRKSDLLVDPSLTRNCIIEPYWIIRGRHYHTTRWIKKRFFLFKF